MVIINSSVLTDVGKVRDSNEDSYYSNGRFKENSEVPDGGFDDTKRRERYLYAVCDGMGGEKFGQLASLIAVKTLAPYQTSNIKATVKEYVQKANALICAEMDKHGGVRIGTTLAILSIQNGKAVSYNIGDSKVYLFRKNKLVMLSEDHTQAQRLVRMRLLKKEAAAGHKDRHKLTQHLGIYPSEMIIQPYVSKEIAVRKNDVYLLCSDGLTDMVGDKRIAEILSSKESGTASAADRLVKTALENGGKDNVTVIVAACYGTEETLNE